MSDLQIETVHLGQPWADAATADEAAIAARRAAAEAIVFPLALGPVGGDAIARYGYLTGRLGAAGYGEALAMLHGRETAGDPELARLMRSPEAIDDVGNAAARLAVVHAITEANATDAAIAKYKHTVAAQLATTAGELGDASRELLKCGELEQHLAAAIAKHQAHAATAVAKVEEEQREAARVVAAAARARVAAATAAAVAAAATHAEATRILRETRADALAERLEASGLKTLRLGQSRDSPLYGVADLIGTARSRSASLDLMERVEHALDEAGR